MAAVTANPDYTTLLATLAKVQQHDFAILRLSEEISAAGSRGDHTYNSDASNLITSSPNALQAELVHYKVPSPPSLPPSCPTATTATTTTTELTRARNYSRNSASATSSK